MNKTDLIAKVSATTGFTKKDTDTLINALLSELCDALKEGEKVALSGFGTFEVREKSARDGVNPRTGEAILIPSARQPVFKAGKTLRDLVAG